MSTVFHESEHQELFYLNADLSRPLDLHVPSALGPLRYYIALRVSRRWAGQFTKVTAHARLTGLRCTDATVRWGDGVAVPAEIPSKVDGQVWILLARIPMARGDGQLTVQGLPAGLGPVDLLLCTWTRFIASGQADDWIASQSDPQWAPSGVPLGGIGVGRVDICRDGRFRNFSGNNNQDMPFEEPDGLDGAFLSVRKDGEERLLATRPMAGIAPCPTLQTEFAFPQAILAAPDVFPDVDVAVRLSGPLIPHDLRTSSLPCALLQWQVRNRGHTAIRIGCRFAWPNLVGQGGGIGEPEERIGYGDGYYRFWTAPKAPVIAPTGGGNWNWHGLKYGNASSPVSPSADGHHIIAVRSDVHDIAMEKDDSMRGWILQELEVPAEGERTVAMALAWDMPHWVDSQGVDRGIHWRNSFRDGEALLDHVFEHFDEILKKAGALQRLLADTDLPQWLRERLLNCRYPLVTNSVLYPDGRFSINEGPTEMSGVYGTIDQRLAAHPATQLFFPMLNEKELDLFSQTMNAEGEVNHDLGAGHLENESRGQTWPDIQCSFAIQQARHAWSLGDVKRMANCWPQARRALERHGRWADEGQGVAQLGKRTGLGTSYDSYHYEGTTAYIGTLWIAGLQIGRRWAKEVGDHAFIERADHWIEAARARLDADLWNGRFYRAYAGRDVPPNENSHGGMLAGEYYARLLAGCDVLPPERLRSCAEALLELHGSPKFAVPPDEVDPTGGAGSLYGWLPYIEAFCIAPLAVLGHREALAVWERMVRVMQGDGKHPCDTRLMYRPVTGELSWGAWYMTAPASWLVYDAFLDFRYEPVDGVLRLRPQFEGRFAVIHPLFWAVGSQAGNGVEVKIRHVFAGQPIEVRKLEMLKETREVTVGRAKGRRGGEGEVYAQFEIPAVKLGAEVSLAWEVD